MKTIAAALLLGLALTATPAPAHAQDLTQAQINRITVKFRTAQLLHDEGKHKDALVRLKEIDQLTGGTPLPNAVNLKIKVLIALGRFQDAQRELNGLYNLPLDPEISDDIARYEPKITAGVTAERQRLARERKAKIERERRLAAERKRKEDKRRADQAKRDKKLAIHRAQVKKCVDGPTCFKAADDLWRLQTSSDRGKRPKKYSKSKNPEQLVKLSTSSLRLMLLGASCGHGYQLGCYRAEKWREGRDRFEFQVFDKACQEGVGDACLTLAEFVDDIFFVGDKRKRLNSYAFGNPYKLAIYKNRKEATRRSFLYTEVGCHQHGHLDSCLHMLRYKKTAKGDTRKRALKKACKLPGGPAAVAKQFSFAKLKC